MYVNSNESIDTSVHKMIVVVVICMTDCVDERLDNDVMELAHSGSLAKFSWGAVEIEISVFA